MKAWTHFGAFILGAAAVAFSAWVIWWAQTDTTGKPDA